MKEGDKVTLGDTTLTAHEMPGHSPGCAGWEMTVKDGGQDREVLFFSRHRGAEPAGRPADLSRHRRRLSRNLRQGQGDEVDVLLGPHRRSMACRTKRTQQIKDATPNPFVKPGELATYAAGLQRISTSSSPSRRPRSGPRNSEVRRSAFPRRREGERAAIEHRARGAWLARRRRGPGRAGRRDAASRARILDAPHRSRSGTVVGGVKCAGFSRKSDLSTLYPLCARSPSF